MTDAPEVKPGPLFTIATHLDLRDWFAGQALVAGLAAYFPPEAARRAYELADAMVAERERRKEPKP